MTRPEPFNRCCDVWPRGLPDKARKAYDAMMQAKELQIIKVTLQKSTGCVVVEYLSNIPHEWMLEALKKQKEN